ncbi:MAG: RHS repeat protein [Burkholderiaceae bacterium]|nr:RHS repeat protein [Burkholderiaceae bacterium]
MASVSLWARFARAVSILLLPLAAGVLLAAEQSYDYDPLGRLVRSTAGGNSVEYRYDAAGNLLEVTGNLPVSAPAISSVTPDALRRGQVAQITLDGSGLAYSSVTAPSSAFTLSGVNAQSSTLAFNLAVADDTTLGAHTFTVSNSAGSANFVLTVNPKLPVLSVEPLPLAVAPDSVPRSFSITLTNADTVPHTVNLATSNSAIATVSPASLTIAPGQTSVLANLTGVSGGTTTLSLTSPTLQTAQAPVFVTADFAGINTSHAPLLGVVLEKLPDPPTQQTVQLGTYADVGVVVGGHLRDIAPQAVPQGASMTLTLFGKGLETATAVSLNPADSVSLGSLTAAPDGLSASLPITVAANAPATLRQLVLTDGAGNRFPAARADSDRLLIAYPAPVVESITPMFGTVGTPISVTLRGRNLQQGKVQLSPGTGIQVDGSPVVNASGTEMTFNLGISSFISLGEHLITVSTPGGISAADKGPENTLTIVSSIDEVVTPITAPQVGVVLQADTQPGSQAYGLEASHVGVAMGPVVTGMSPRAGIIGETVALSLQGQELDGVTTLSFAPADGITVNSLTPAPDGKSVNASVTIAADAPRTMRTIKALAGTTAIPFSDIRQSQFQVTAPLPRVDSVTPVNLAVGTGPVTLTVRGVNFKDASGVAVSPAAGITVSQPPVVNADATEITVNVTVDPAAAIGQRVVTVTTPAGVTDAEATPANTLNLVNILGDIVTPIQAPALGVVKLDDTPPPTVDSLLASPNVGVVLQTDAPPPTTQEIFLGNARLGVAVGPVATALQATALHPGGSGTLTVSGVGLDAVALVGVSLATGITLGTPSVQPDGMSLTVPITLAADAPAGAKTLTLSDGIAPVLFTEAAAARFIVATGEPRIDSITPILARQGDTATLTIRGAHLNHASVLIEPVAGVVLGSAPTVNADGTELSLGVYVPADAALGGRVIRVQTPGGISTDQAAPANTFTVFPP